MPSHHNRYSRKPERERRGQRPNYYWAAESHQSSRSPARLAVSGKLSNFDPFRLGLERRALRHHTLLDEPPQGDRQFAGESDNANLPATHAHLAEPLLPPTGELAVRLVAKPEPSKFDKGLSRELRSRLVDSAVSIYVATRLRTWRKSDE